MKPPQTNPRNDRAKREYLIYLKEARQRSQATVEEVRRAIDRLEGYTVYKDFGSFNKEQAKSFKHALLNTKAKRSGKPISTSTAYHTLQMIKEFLIWLQGRPGYRRRIDLADVAFLNLTTKQQREAHVRTPKHFASLEQYRAVLVAMPAATEMDRRDKALLAFLLLTGMRDAAVVGIKLRHVSIERRHVFQDPRDINTKFSKAIETFFYPVGEDIEVIVKDWVRFLSKEKLFGPDDPLFPKTAVGVGGEGAFAAQGLSREQWSNAAPVRQLFRAAFARAGLAYVKPHTVRDTLTQLAYKLQLTPEQLKAWSQNMGHESVLTTLGSYGQISSERQGEIIQNLNRQKNESADDEIAIKIADMITARLKKGQG
jgi:integrase